ncbi:MAG: 30S ribosomal protein S6 [Planctomycetota bacterium]|jgi:small subunit ribosomal protein S6
MKLYEAMFLVDSAEATADWEGINAVIRGMLEKIGAEIISMRKWDDRRLAYEIRGKSRGTYILCYFRAEGGRIREIERDVQLSEQVIRVLILSAEHMKQEDIEKDTPVVRAEKHRHKGAAAARTEVKSEQEEQKKEDIKQND